MDFSGLKSRCHQIYVPSGGSTEESLSTFSSFGGCLHFVVHGSIPSSLKSMTLAELSQAAVSLIVPLCFPLLLLRTLVIILGPL
jgi:hypothetical protein